MLTVEGDMCVAKIDRGARGWRAVRVNFGMVSARRFTERNMMMSSASTEGYTGYSDHKGWSDIPFGSYSADDKVYFAAELKRHGIALRGAKILEIGYGNGSFLACARNAGAEIVGIEIQESLRERAAAQGFATFESLDAFARNAGSHSQDLIVAFDVLEHLTPAEILHALATMEGLLKPATGRFVARFPNADSPFSLSLQNGDYTHRTALGQGTVLQLMTQSGWRDLYLGEPVWVAGTSRGQLKLALRTAVRRSMDWLIRTIFMGSSGPKTLYHNYILVAAPPQT
jgi:2-polyprenyl-3-methyl-5-hydroxy-6-metoxy-1,4-benzoquinol methylase